jgi:hypothetical protein
MSRPRRIFPTPGPILETDYVNTRRSPLDNRSDWPKRLVGGKTFMSIGAHRYDWVSVLDPDSQYDQPLTGLSGTALKPDVSKSDNPFLHPFGNDFEFFIAPDPPYYSLLAPRMINKGYSDATSFANSKYGLNVPGVIGMEMDERLVPTQFRAKEGDRVAVWGRWIVDSGHDDYHTEIHPPLIMATARGSRSAQQAARDHRTGEATTVQIITRPYLVSQEFGDGGLFEHLLIEVAKVVGLVSVQVEAHPRLLDMPFRGLNVVTFKVRPPNPRRSVRDRLIVEFNMTRRDDSVAIQVLKGSDGDSLRVIIVLNEAGYTPPPRPKAVRHTVTATELDRDNPEAGDAYRKVLAASALLDKEAAVIFNKGIKSTKYVKPKAPVAGPVTRVRLNNLRPVHADIDTSQPFPLFGTLKIEWERDKGRVGRAPPSRLRSR